MTSKGFTLVEVLISALLLSIIGFMIVEVSLTAGIIYDREAAFLDLQEQARLTMNSMTYELRSAKTATPNATDGSITFDTPNATGIRYYLNNSQVIREYPPGNRTYLGNNISVMNFSADGSLLTIQLCTSKNVRGTAVVFPTSGNLTELVELRNE
jgi:prepilin-type N-terminal cleavage/methylation domain-containing protein